MERNLIYSPSQVLSPFLDLHFKLLTDFGVPQFLLVSRRLERRLSPLPQISALLFLFFFSYSRIEEPKEPTQTAPPTPRYGAHL